MVIADRIAKLRAELGSVRLVAVTKDRSSAEVLAVLHAGVADIAENRLQEAEEKFAQLRDDTLFAKCTKHFIGHVQSNKAAKIAALFDVVQSVDSTEIAEKLSAAAQKLGKTLMVFLEVNATGELQKYGIIPAGVPALATQIRKLPNLSLVGIMGMGPQASEVEIRPCFRMLQQLQQQLQLSELSIGMSADYRIALQEGATQVRIGTLLFSTSSV